MTRIDYLHAGSIREPDTAIWSPRHHIEIGRPCGRHAIRGIEDLWSEDGGVVAPPAAHVLFAYPCETTRSVQPKRILIVPGDTGHKIARYTIFRRQQARCAILPADQPC